MSAGNLWKQGVCNLKKILLIHNEWARDDFGLVKGGILPEIEEEFYHITNLIETVSSFPDCTVQPVFYQDITPELVSHIAPDYIIASGRAKDWDFDSIEAAYASELELIRTTDIPFLGICAGHQLIALAYGSRIGKLSETEEDVREMGFVDVEVDPDPLFKGLEPSVSVLMAHRDEVKALPNGFRAIGHSSMCQYAAIAHQTKPMWGVQFHPEIHTPNHQDGTQILRNFLQR